MSVITRGTFENVEPERAFTILIHELKKKKKKTLFPSGISETAVTRRVIPLFVCRVIFYDIGTPTL